MVTALDCSYGFFFKLKKKKQNRIGVENYTEIDIGSHHPGPGFQSGQYKTIFSDYCFNYILDPNCFWIKKILRRWISYS